MLTALEPGFQPLWPAGCPGCTQYTDFISSESRGRSHMELSLLSSSVSVGPAVRCSSRHTMLEWLSGTGFSAPIANILLFITGCVSAHLILPHMSHRISCCSSDDSSSQRILLS